MNAQAIASENWDDDFEFNQSASAGASGSNNSRHAPSKNVSIKQNQNHNQGGASTGLEPRLSVTSHFSEDWDVEEGEGLGPLAQSPSQPSNVGVMASGLASWAEPGPSTPTKRRASGVVAVQRQGEAEAENWDDDFVDKAESPPRHLHSQQSHHQHHANPLPSNPSAHHHQALTHQHHLRTRHSYHTPPRPKLPPEPENWDDDFDDPMDANPAKPPTSSTTDNDATPMTKRTRHDPSSYPDYSSDDDDAEFGFSEHNEEDKTVTARSRSLLMLRTSGSATLPPVPALPTSLNPIEPFPRSPTVSVFSIPTTSGRNSVGYTSTSHLALRPTLSGGGGRDLAMLPPSPPIHRERRRLRKKSRPPHLDNNVFELVEEQRDYSPPPALPPSTPERPSSPALPPDATPGASASGGGSGKTPLLSRIGSVKRWGVRRKRASTGPGEVMLAEFGSGPLAGGEDRTPRPPSSLAQSPPNPTASSSNGNGSSSGSKGWFFRPGGPGSPPPPGAGRGDADEQLRHERSLDGVRAVLSGGGGAPVTPSKSRLMMRKPSRGGIGLEASASSSGELVGEGSSGSGAGAGKPSLMLSARRPTSMQVPAGKFPPGGGSGGTRHASYGSSVGRAASSRVFSTPTPTESLDDLHNQVPPVPSLEGREKEGSRSFMGSVRKISLVGGGAKKGHKKKKSGVGGEVGTGVEVMPSVPATPAFQDQHQRTPRPPRRSGDRKGNMGGDRDRERDQDVQMMDLLPPIELQPPSPPRTINASRSAPVDITDGVNIESLLVPSSSAPGSVSLSPRSLLASSPVTSSPVAHVKSSPKTLNPSSPQSASLGRATQVPNPPPGPVAGAGVPRRNSLGDLKIPARISQAQIGLKRDLGMVREFAASVDRLKELQSTYYHLIAEVHVMLESAPPSRATSPTILNFARPRSRLRSNTAPNTASTSVSASTGQTFAAHKHLAASLHAITTKYKVPWECAELLIELGGGTPAPTSPPVPTPSSSVSAPSMSVQAEMDRRKSRERAVTLSGEEGKPVGVPFVGSVGMGGAIAMGVNTSGPPNASWRASTGRHDLSQRQLVLLRDMLNNGEVLPDDMAHIPEDPPYASNPPSGVNRNWRWGDAMSSTVTLPSEESGSRGAFDLGGAGSSGGADEKKKRRMSRMGMSGLRDMLRMLKRSQSQASSNASASTPPIPPIPIVPASTASLSTESSIGSQCHHQQHHYPHGQVSGQRRGSKTSTGPESVRSMREMANSPYGGPPLNHKASPRRPSLASIFRIGQKNKSGNGGAESSTGESSQDSRSDVRSASRGSNMTGEEEDWDRIDSAIDLDTAARALGITTGIEGSATIKGKKGRVSPYPGDYGPRPVTPKRGPDLAQALRVEAEASPRSIRPMRSTRLSNVEEVEDGGERQPRSASKTKAKNRRSLPRTSPHRPPSRGQQLLASQKTGSVRSAPPQPLDDGHVLPDFKLSMTPENIKPLLENAKEVDLRLNDCIRELRVLLDTLPASSNSNAGPSSSPPS